MSNKYILFKFFSTILYIILTFFFVVFKRHRVKVFQVFQLTITLAIANKLKKIKTFKVFDDEEKKIIKIKTKINKDKFILYYILNIFQLLK